MSVITAIVRFVVRFVISNIDENELPGLENLGAPAYWKMVMFYNMVRTSTLTTDLRSIKS